MKITPLSLLRSAVTGVVRPWSAGDTPQATPTPSSNQPERTRLTGASFAEQEPDLAKEARLSTRTLPGWAAGGSGLPE